MDLFRKQLLTDFYELTMAYALWKAGKAADLAVFDLYFRKNPFCGEFTIFAGLNECLTFLQNFSYSREDIAYLRSVWPNQSNDLEEFFTFLEALDLHDVTIWAVDEGTVVFPNVPLLIIRGPLIACQLLETTLLNLVNFASLVTTNAVRFRLAAGDSKRLYELGLRRAQGPNGGLSASLYSYIGGFDGTSNILAGKMFGIPIFGTQAHSFITSFAPIELQEAASSDQDTNEDASNPPKLTVEALTKRSWKWLFRLQNVLNFNCDQIKSGELNAFVHFAFAFPNSFVGLVDTYNVTKTGLLCFCAVALGLHEFNFRAKGIRIDSGDLAYLSLIARKVFTDVATEFNLPWFKDLQIAASNNLDEDTIQCLNQQKHSIDVFGVGTNLVTCQSNPALGCVYKMVEINGSPVAKLSENQEKSSLPGHKLVYRLYGRDSIAILDLLQLANEEPPKPGQRVLSRHAYHPTKMVYVEPSKVLPLHSVVWDGKSLKMNPPKMVHLSELRARVVRTMAELRADHKRHMNPSPYKVSLSEQLYRTTQDTWLSLVSKLVLS